jgi:DNA-binding MurR/RpiR family transcriptional regulator
MKQIELHEDPFLLIKSNYIQMHPAMKRIADVLISRQNISGGMSISELASSSGVSNATVTRFVQMLGFENYKSFSQAIRKYGHIATSAGLPGEGGDMLAYAGGRPNSSDAESVCRYVISSEIEMLNDTLAMMDFNVMEKVAELLCRARQVIFAGEGRSYLAAKSAVTRFSGIGILCSCHDSLHGMIPAVCMCKPEDLVIGISNMGHSAAVTECLKQASACQASTVAITCVKGSPVDLAAQNTILTGFNYGNFASGGQSTCYEPGSENLPQYSVIDCLYLICAMRQNQSCLEQYRRASNILDAGRI